MSFRIKLLSWIVAVNLGITGLLLVAVSSNIRAQSEGYEKNAERFAEQQNEIFRRFEDLLALQREMLQQELPNIGPDKVLEWLDWSDYRDAMVLMDYTELDGEIVNTDILINPLGRRHRVISEAQARHLLETASLEDRPVVQIDDRNPENIFIAVPIHLRSEEFLNTPGGDGNGMRSWGAALVQPKFPVLQEPVDYFDWVLFWVAMAGGTLFLIGVTYTILSKVVIHPVERMALAADRVANGDYSVHCPATGSRDEIGRLISSFNFMLDEVRDYHHHLEEKVREAQAKMQAAEQHLVIAQRLAATGKLASGIAHEINNPIGGMINAALSLKEKAAKDPGGERARVYIDLILEGLEKIKGIVQKVLVFTPRSLTPSHVPLLGLLKDTRLLVEHRLIREEIELDIEVEPEDLLIFCEPGELRQVFLNLLINAVDAVESRNGRIAINGKMTPDGKNISIEIKDNGCGMDPSELGRAFDLFHTTKEAGKGTGLGLSIAHNIVMNHGGLIMAESEKGRGTTIKVLLPAREEA